MSRAAASCRMGLARHLLPLLVVAALASGCLADQPATFRGDLDAPAAPEGANAGTPATHSSPQRDDGTVEVRSEGGQTAARRTVTVSNDFGGAGRSHVVLGSFNGALVLKASTDGGYHFTAEMYGRGQTEQEARQALDLLRLQNTDDLRDGELELSFALTANTPAALPLPIVVPNGANNGASYTLWLPPEPAHDLEAGTSNGAIAVEGLHGPRLKAGTSNGAIASEGGFDVVEARSSNGAISLEGTFNDVEAQTTNAAIAVEIRPTRTAAVRLATSNGAIVVDLPRDGTAFDITADTSNGRVIIEVEDRDSVSDDHASYRSPSWSSAGRRLTLDLDTSNASIVVED
jgi:hypothetical protein